MKNILALIIMLLPLLGHAQNIDQIMQEGDKINVVYTVILIILTGFVGYLFYLDLKVKKLDKKFTELNIEDKK